MATSSIFHDFTINDEESARRLLEALEASEKDLPWKPSKKVKYKDLRDPEEIGALMAKWEARLAREKEVDK